MEADETEMGLLVNNEIIPVTYREAERIYRRLPEIFDTPTVKHIKEHIGNGGPMENET